MAVTIRLVNDGVLSNTDFLNVVQAVRYYVPLVTKAWGLPPVTVVSGATANPGDWLINISEKNVRQGASGYHGDVNGVPIAWCSLRMSGRIYGHYSKPMIYKGVIQHPAMYTPGLVTTICHEIAEMLCDPEIQAYSQPDAQGRSWLVEVCDHVFGYYQVYFINGNPCILPDVTTPNFYKIGATAPFSIFGGATAPFTMTKNGYGYWKDSHGALEKI